MHLFRHIRHAAALSATALIFCAANLHAAWNLKFPFYHEDQPPAPPVTIATAPRTQAPPAVQAPVPQTPQDRAGKNPALPTVASVPPDIELRPVLPVPTAPPAQGKDQRPKGRPAVFEDARRIPATTYTEDTAWQGKIRLDEWITVAPQATLTIDPGTIIRVNDGSGINVLGRIVVKGADDNPVTVTSLSSEPFTGEWQGIILTGSEKKNILENLRIEGAETALLARYSSFTARGITISRAVTGLHLQESVAVVDSGRISDSGTGIALENSELTLDTSRIETNRTGISLKTSALAASETTLTGNRSIGLAADDSRLMLDRFLASGSETGARISRSKGSIADSVFSDNSEAGAMLSGSRLRVTGSLFSRNRIGLQVDDHLPVLWNNALFANKGYNLLYMGEEGYFAGGNWFGAGERETVGRTLFSKRDGALRAEPYLGANPVDSERMNHAKDRYDGHLPR